MHCSVKPCFIPSGARGSKLSRVQVEEVQKELSSYVPDVFLEPLWIETAGDKDKKTSLRLLDKTDFFTREIDQALMDGRCRIAVHSAKDLPDPIPKELSIIAVTKGMDSSDSLVFRKDGDLKSLAKGAKVATSSLQRENRIKGLRSDFHVVDLRGTIEERLEKLQKKEVDGIVVAECALIRLNLTHLPRVPLPGFSTPGQGQLVVLARKDDLEMKALFAPIDSRKKILYLGLREPKESIQASYLHCPIITIAPRALSEPDIEYAFSELIQATHLLFTSQTAVELFFESLKEKELPDSILHDKMIFAIGKKTALKVREFGFDVDLISSVETMEGLIELINDKVPSESHFFWPHSALSRPLLKEYLTGAGHQLTEVVLYETYPKKPRTLPNAVDYDEILFTSPSTVDAFLQFFESFPEGKAIGAIGATTKKYLENVFNLRGVYEV